VNPFTYVEGSSVDAATRAVGSAPQASFFAGGTTLVDLMKIHVLTPTVLVDVSRLPLGKIELIGDAIHVGANVRNSQLAWHPAIRERYPALSEAILSGASTQLRNMATTAGNIMQRTRCPYFRDVHAACNKREPGSSCDAIDGINRGHAVLGTSDKCIAVFPSDMCVALAIFDAIVRTRKADGSTRDIPFEELHCLPGDTPERETILEHGELITHVVLPALPLARRSHYRKVRDRVSYEFALASAAVALSLDGDTIADARVALGGVAVRPWRARDAERVLVGNRRSPALLRAAADAALAVARAQRQNGFKIELAKRTIIRALDELAARPG
jgi:xanthine dehydrogenase YagS FAD-binding subunit